jgi:RHS repeat-associated protein
VTANDGQTRTFRRDGTSVTSPVLSDGQATYTPGISERRGTVSRFMHSGLKNAESRTVSSTAIESVRTYDAFGNVLSTAGGSWTGAFGYAGACGYQEDPSGLKLLGHRYYDSETGRFISRDPAEDGRNWYTYCWNNPVNRKDADGLRISFLFKVVTAAGAYLMTGISFHPFQRYSKRQLQQMGGQGTRVKRYARYDGPPGRAHSQDALRDERMAIREDPGPLNRERWAGADRHDDGVVGGGGAAGMVPMVATLRQMTETLDPTPVRLGMELGETLGEFVEPWKETNQRKNWKIRGSGGFTYARYVEGVYSGGM